MALIPISYLFIFESYFGLILGARSSTRLLLPLFRLQHGIRASSRRDKSVALKLVLVVVVQFSFCMQHGTLPCFEKNTINT